MPQLVSELDLPYLDTGLLYRATARLVLNAGRDPNDPVVAVAQAERLAPGDLERNDLRTPEVDQAAASVASIPGVRAALLAFQRKFGADRGAVLDGRDIGTVIFPDADVKLYVDANVDARAQRRWKELAARGVDISLQSVTDDMQARDAADVARAAAPLRAADDAVVLDTSLLDADAAFEKAIGIVKGRLLF